MNIAKLPKRYQRPEDQKAHEARVTQFAQTLQTATPEQVSEARAYYTLRMQNNVSRIWAQDYMAALETMSS